MKFNWIVFLFLLILSTQIASAANVIAGIVYDRSRNPLNAVDVELLDEYYRLLQRVRTDAVGRYQFGGLNNGNYTVRVQAFQYDLQDQSQYIELQAISARPGDPGSTFINQDFYLQPKRGGIKELELSVVFAQEIPKEAKAQFELALSSFGDKRDSDGFDHLKKALQIFPTYYDALSRFGTELFTRKQYRESLQVFIKAAEVNPRSATSFYYVGFSCFNLGPDYRKATLRSLNHALSLAPTSYKILWLLGRAERAAGKFNEAEKHLLLAKKESGSKVPQIHKELSQLYANDLKRYAEAAAELELYMKTSKLEGKEEKQTKAIINNLRLKAKTQNNG